MWQLVSPVNRQRLKCHRMQRRRANGWFTSWTKFAFKGCPPPTICARIDRPVNAVQLCRWQFLHKATLQQTFLEIPSGNWHFLVFLTPFGGLEAGYDVDHRLIGKCIVDFLLVIIELFSLGAMIQALRANIDWKSPFLKRVGGSVWPKISDRWGRLPPTICARLDRPVALQLCRWMFSHKETL